MSLKNIGTLQNEIQRLVCLEIAENLLAEHPRIAKKIFDAIDAQIREFNILKQSLILTNDASENRISIPQSVIDFDAKKAELRFEMEQAKKKEFERIKQEAELENIRIREEAEMRKVQAEANQQAKIESGLIFGKWEMSRITLKASVRFGEPEILKPCLRFQSTRDRDFVMIYYIKEQRMKFVYPYIDEIKDYMKLKLGMNWENEGWNSTDFRTDCKKLAEKWPDPEKVFDCSKSFGSGRRKYSKTNELRNIFPDLHEVIEKLDTLYPKV